MNFVQISCILWMSAILFLVIVNEAQSQAMITRDSQHPDYPGLCYYKDEFSPEATKSTFFLKPGQRRKHPKNCFKVECSNSLELSVVGCGIGADQQHCRYIGGDNSRPYPHCCGELIC